MRPFLPVSKFRFSAIYSLVLIKDPQSLKLGDLQQPTIPPFRQRNPRQETVAIAAPGQNP
jgi:hypothetical protein